jgi:hypothetical protein
MYHDVNLIKLGKKAAKHDSRMPMLASYRTGALPTPPANIMWSRNVTQFGMMLNNTLGDCTCAALGHAIQVWTLNTSSMFTCPDNIIEGVYEKVGGYVPGDESTDNGAVMLDVCRWWMANNVGGHTIAGFAGVTPGDTATVKDAIWMYGGIYAGVLLPVTAQTQKIWMRTPGALTGDSEPGSWGGHAIYIVGYDDRYLYCITWGGIQAMTWEWFQTYCDEAYVFITHDWIASAKNQSPSGFDYDTLLADQKAYFHYLKALPVSDEEDGKPVGDVNTEGYFAKPAGTGLLDKPKNGFFSNVPEVQAVPTSVLQQASELETEESEGTDDPNA